MTWVFIAGAGFSRAIADAMPLTDELGGLVLEQLRDEIADLPVRTFSYGTFESWLSRLAEPQPDLSDEMNRRHQHWFAAVSRVICEVIFEHEARSSDFVPWWLQRLLTVAHVRQLPLITFNYDTLVERAVERMLLIERPHGARALADHIVDHLPPTPHGLSTYTPIEAETLHLLKLHGSVNWFWVSGDKTGATIARLPFASASSEALRSRYVPGRSPFIVPPSAAKTAYYENPITRETWRRASTALRQADGVALLGYSLPITDLVTSGMFSECVARPGARIDVVNPSPHEVVERVQRLGVPSSAIAVFDGPDAIERYVADELEPNALGDMLERVRGAGPSQRAVVGIAEGEHRTCWIDAIDRVADTVELHVGPVNPRFSVTAAVSAGRPSDATIDRIVRCADGATDLVVVYQDGQRARIHDMAAAHPAGARPGEWLLLIPTAFPATAS